MLKNLSSYSGRLTPRGDGPGYFFYALADKYQQQTKIGIAKNLADRLASYFTHNPHDPFYFLAIKLGARGEAFALESRVLEAHSTKDEWLDVAPRAFLEWFEQNKEKLFEARRNFK